MLKRALFSVYNKEGIVELAEFLQERGVEILSTGGTYRYLVKCGIKVREVSEVTGSKEILDGRVKTLHPVIHGGILAIRENEEHMKSLEREGIQPIDMVVVNLYPFFEKVKEDLTFQEKVEFIDIGGPTMLRAAAKNFQDVIVLTDPKDYKGIIQEIKEKEAVSLEVRKVLAGKVFNLMGAYDAAVSQFLLGTTEYPEHLQLSYKKEMNLRYGENPHQRAAFYKSTMVEGAMNTMKQLHGKELSYNNIKDMDIAWKVVCEFEEIVCCAVKHNTPCGVALGISVLDAYKKAYECDAVSIYGGIVAWNKKVDAETAKELIKTFIEVVVAPEYEEEALQIFKTKKNLRVIQCSEKSKEPIEVVSVDGGILVQERDSLLIDQINVVTEKAPLEKYKEDLIFGMKVVKYVKSNAIVVVKEGAAIGIGGGQVNRIWSAVQALDRAKSGVILASDAFFPFGDIVEEAEKYKIQAIIQPGGSIRDQESVARCNEYGIPMVFTGMRHFKH